MPNVYFDAEPSGLHGRPKLILNEEGKKLIESLSEIMCTDEEIAACMNVSVDTLMNANNRAVFTECKQKGMSTGKKSLRRIQFELAKKNAPMAIFLGRNYLGQTNTDEQKIELTNGEKSQLIVALRSTAKQLEATPDIPEGEDESDNA